MFATLVSYSTIMLYNSHFFFFFFVMRTILRFYNIQFVICKRKFSLYKGEIFVYISGKTRNMVDLI